MSYLEFCQKKITELVQLVSSIDSIADNADIDITDRYYLIYATPSYGRIVTLFDELEIPFDHAPHDPLLFGHEDCIRHLRDDMKPRLGSLSALLPKEGSR